MTSDLFSLAGRIACVTGASSGIGRAIADILADAGAAVVGVARRAERLTAWQEATAARGARAAGCAADVAALETLPDLARRIAEPFGAPDILVNAAGMNPRRPADQITPEEWRRTLDINLSSAFFLAQALVPAMKTKGWGKIVNLASLQSLRAFPDGIAYGAAKGGLAQVTRAMAEAWSRHGIACNALAPGFFPTELTAPVFTDAALAAESAARTCIGRNGRMEDLVGPVIFLTSPASDYVTGQILYLDGGYTAK